MMRQKVNTERWLSCAFFGAVLGGLMLASPTIASSLLLLPSQPAFQAPTSGKLSYIQHPSVPIAAVRGVGILGLRNGAFDVAAFYRRSKVSSDTYASAMQYVTSCGATSEGDARFRWATFGSATEHGHTHSRRGHIRLSGQRMFSAIGELTSNDEDYLNFLWRDGDEASSTFNLQQADGTVVKGPLKRWKITGNRFYDLSQPTSSYLKQCADLELVLRGVEPLLSARLAEGEEAPALSSGTRTLTEREINLIPKDGVLGSVGHSGDSITWRLTREQTSAKLIVLWSDRNDSPHLRHTVIWLQTGADAVPSELKVEEFLPGTDEVVAWSSFRIKEAPLSLVQDREALAAPEEREYVSDSRFETLVRYNQIEEGELNEDEIRRRSHRAAMSNVLGEEVLALRRMERITPVESGARRKNAGLQVIELDVADGVLEFLLTPEEWVFPSRGVGAELPFVFEIHNASEEEVRVARVKPDCGCTTFELSDYTIGAGQVVHLRGRQEVQGIGWVSKRIMLELETALGNTELILKLKTHGTGAVVAPEPVYDLGTIVAGSGGMGELLYLTFDCASKQAKPVFVAERSRGTTTVLEWAIDDGVAKASFRYDPAADQRLGAFHDLIGVRGPLCQDASESLAMIHGTLGEEPSAEWPNCWIVLGGGVAQCTLEFPVAIQTVVTEAQARGAPSVELRATEEGGTHARFELATEAADQALFEFVLDSTAGPIAVVVVVLGP
ncbi:MAG: hypothetical protein ACI841_000154 [Planctomycetota bacterium]|jgi:hypothetical protein